MSVAQDLLATLKREPVEIEGKSGPVTVYAAELMTQDAHVLDPDDDGKDRNSEAIAACILGEDGLPVFTLAEVRTLPWRLSAQLLRAITKVNGWSLAEVEEAEKN